MLSHSYHKLLCTVQYDRNDAFCAERSRKFKAKGGCLVTGPRMAVALCLKRRWKSEEEYKREAEGTRMIHTAQTTPLQNGPVLVSAPF